ncbi:type III restriction endonuclease subunit M [[Mycoplasma] gypis]|uniref:type III restriction endonuclease subunit M n=1 Tax=[Mycoplasma] gypis TaxID=92404 RepID=UPI0019679E26|nr:type III restriction endonuclease subunit M [[Mycoplasma] gypis]MBN0919355.1 type III restriction endonuclease subunit M [[Mycoplasma] gypis]
MNTKDKTLRQLYIDKLDEISNSVFNEDQKTLTRHILNSVDEREVQNVYQLLLQRVKLGLRFDVSPTPIIDNQYVTLLKRNEKLSIGDQTKQRNKNMFIIGENFDVLNNLILVERERERERERDSSNLSMM